MLTSQGSGDGRRVEVLWSNRPLEGLDGEGSFRYRRGLVLRKCCTVVWGARRYCGTRNGADDGAGVPRRAGSPAGVHGVMTRCVGRGRRGCGLVRYLVESVFAQRGGHRLHHTVSGPVVGAEISVPPANLDIVSPSATWVTAATCALIHVRYPTPIFHPLDEPCD